MKKVLLLLSGMCAICGCGACTQNSITHDNTVKDFELQRFLGSWYEIARIDHYFEKGMAFTQATYTLQDNGTVKVENCGYKKGKFKKSIGVAKRPNPQKEPGLMRVSFFRPFYSDYRVLMIDPEYQYALISSSGPNYLWILARENVVPVEVLQEMVSVARGCGFDVSRLTWVTQTLD